MRILLASVLSAIVLFHFAYDALSWLLAGAIIAAVFKPRE